jgi:Kef-type K+ transport system membrane component KefB
MADSETEQERLDRELIELLNELRVALPGVQVLFAFLLTVPFSQRFGTLDSADRRSYFIAVLFTALSAAFLIAPSAQHRMRFRDRAKAAIIKVGTVCSLLGLGFLAGAVGLSIHFVTRVLYDSTIASVIAGLVTAGTVILWFVVPRFFPRD